MQVLSMQCVRCWIYIDWVYSFWVFLSEFENQVRTMNVLEAQIAHCYVELFVYESKFGLLIYLFIFGSENISMSLKADKQQWLQEMGPNKRPKVQKIRAIKQRGRQMKVAIARKR